MDSAFGNLYVIATPIGNLKDISYRAVELLASVDCIVSEDTRETKKLLDCYEINNTQLVYTDQRHKKMAPQLIEMLKSGQNLALLSDNGTPVISDPGFKLVSECKQAGINVVPIPGANAAIAALSVSGLPTDKFSFLGFMPKSASKQKDLLEKYGSLDSTLIIYESPYRIKKLLKLIQETLGDRHVSVARELTKLHEQVITNCLSDLGEIKEKGEFVVLIAKENFNG